MRVGLNVCVLDSLGLLELATFHQVAKKKQEFIFPQRFDTKVKVSAGLLLKALEKCPSSPPPASGCCELSLACSRIQALLLRLLQPLVVVSFPWLAAASSLYFHLHVASSSVCLSPPLSPVRRPVIGFGSYQGHQEYVILRSSILSAKTLLPNKGIFKDSEG